MVMKLLRDGASGGIGKFILFGLLVMAVAGLALMDVGGFFRGGTGANNAIKIDGKAIAIQDFDREVRRQLAPLGISPQDAYRMGYMEQIIAGEIRKELIQDTAHKNDINVAREQVAAHIKELIKPLTEGEQDPTSVLTQILRTQGLSEEAFEQSIRYEITNSLISDALSAGAAKISTDVIDGLYQYQKEKRNIEYIKFHDSEMDIEPPSEEALLAYYEELKPTYYYPENRDIQIITIDESDLLEEFGANAQAILDEKYERLEKLEDSLSAGTPIEEIQKTIPLNTYSIEKITRDGLLTGPEPEISETLKNNIATLSNEAFSLEENEYSMGVEMPGAGFAIVQTTNIHPEGYHEFDKLESQLKARWIKEKQHKETLDRANAVLKELSENKTGLKQYADSNKRNYHTEKNLVREEASAPFLAEDVSTIYAAQKDELKLIDIEGGYAIVNTTESLLPEISDKTRKSTDYQALYNALQQASKNEVIGTKLDALHEKTPAAVNRALLERIYGENSEYY